jgi:hypothetical protein
MRKIVDKVAAFEASGRVRGFLSTLPIVEALMEASV